MTEITSQIISAIRPNVTSLTMELPYCILIVDPRITSSNSNVIHRR